MKNFLIKTLGCKTNQIESAQIEEVLVEHGFIQVQKIELADFLIVNSCSVTQNADDKALAILKHAKTDNPKIKTILTGCFAQLNAEELKENLLIDYLVGNNEKYDIVNILNTSRKNNVQDIFDQKEFNYKKLTKLSKTRASIKIQDGCNNRCSYCTIPFARGLSRSNSVENIIEQVDLFKQNDFKEIVLTGIHIGLFGEDLNPQKNLLNLLEEIEKTGIQRYRLSSLNPLEINDELINFLSKSEKFCPHFHLSLQNTCDKTLKNMNRHYSFNECLKLVEKLNSRFNLPFIGSDIIVGFAGETQEDFEESFKNLKKLDLSQIHVFPYSKRKNTKAYELDDHVKDDIKYERTKLVQKLSASKFQIFLEKNLGTEQEVLIQKVKDKKTGHFVGLTKNYLNVLIDSDVDLRNTIVKVKLKTVTDNKFIGKISAKIRV